MTELLYAPWRETFILGEKPDGCIFCDPEKRRGVRELILHRGKLAFVVLNRYPYNSGHLMVVPCRHVGRLEDLTAAEQKELMFLLALSSKVLSATNNPAGINMGMNLGRAAGAGVDGHLHAHLVPRWIGDTNFMPALFDTRVVSVDLEKVCRRLRTAFRKFTAPVKRRVGS